MRRGKTEVESGGEAISLPNSLLEMGRVRLPRRSHPDFIGTRTPRNDNLALPYAIKLAG